MADWSKTWTWMDGEWFEGNKPLIGLRSQAGWLGSSVFDGARAFEGVIPDLLMHCQRVNNSAEILGMKASVAPERIAEIAREGVAKFADDAQLYIRPMYWAEDGGFMSIVPDPESTLFAVCIYEMAMPEPTGITATTTRFQRPTLNSMPVNAKAGCLYPNNSRMLQEARDKGFENALCCDALGNVAEFASANAFMVKDGTVLTPAANGTFLNGITRRRVIGLLRDAGTSVEEVTLGYDDFRNADEIFATGNYAKVMPVIKFEERNLQPGPITTKARELYWKFAHSTA